MKPITPTEVLAQKRVTLPDFVIETVNALIVKHFNGKSAVVRQRDILQALKSSLPN